MLAAIETEARQQRFTRLVALTTQTAEWFVEHHFAPGTVADLPGEKQALYNFQRNSKVMVKDL